MQQIKDYRAEVDDLATLLHRFSPEQMDLPTGFKGWTVNDVVGHLHMFDVAALKSLEGEAAFAAFFAPVAEAMGRGLSMIAPQTVWLNGLKGPDLVTQWLTTAQQVAEAYADIDPKARLAWAGPAMSARSMITARQMETWAHGQELFDLAGEDRVNHDRIRNIAHLGVVAYGWAFAVRGETAPDPAPRIELTAPSGAVWGWNDGSTNGLLSGSAVGFAQAVTQVRHWRDTDLHPEGEAARAWMDRAQCFAGDAAPPPAPGTRTKAPQQILSYN